MEYLLENNTSFSWKFVVCTIILMLLYVLPQAPFFVRNDLLFIIVMVYYFLFLHKELGSGGVVSIVTFSIPYVLLMGIVSYSDIKLGSILSFITLWNLLIPCLISATVFKRNNIKEKRIILLASAACMLYVYLNSIIAISVTPNFMRYTSFEESPQLLALRMKGAGGFDFAYSMGAMAVAFYVILFTKTLAKNKKVYAFILFALCAMLVVKSQYATLLFITFFGIVFYYFINSSTLAGKLCFVVFLLLVLFSAESLIAGLATYFDGQVLGKKFGMIYDALWGQENAQVVEVSGNRSEWQLNSFRLFLNSPIIGNYVGEGSPHYLDYVRSHSTILATMAATGLIGIISYVGTFFKAIKLECDYLCSFFDVKLFVSIIGYYAFFAFFDPIDWNLSPSWVIFVVIPLIFDFFNTKTA